MAAVIIWFPAVARAACLPDASSDEVLGRGWDLVLLQGTPKPEFALPCRYGLPGGANASRALELYERGAALGDPEALTSLAWMHASGQGLPRGGGNATRALELYAQAMAASRDSMSAAAPWLAYWWTRGLVGAQRWQHAVVSAGGGAAAGLQQDAVNVLILMVLLAGVLWLQRRRSGHRPGRRRHGAGDR